MEIQFVQCDAEAAQGDVEEGQGLCEQSSSIQEIVLKWLKDDRRVVLCGGLKEDDTRAFACILKSGKVDVGQCVVEFSELAESFPNAFSFEDPDKPWNAQGLADYRKQELIDDYLEERDQRFDAVYNEDLGYSVISLDRAMEVAVSYALSPGAHVEVSSLDQDFLDELDVEDSSVYKDFIFCFYEYVDLATRRGWTECFYADPSLK